VLNIRILKLRFVDFRAKTVVDTSSGEQYHIARDVVSTLAPYNKGSISNRLRK